MKYPLRNKFEMLAHQAQFHPFEKYPEYTEYKEAMAKLRKVINSL